MKPSRLLSLLALVLATPLAAGHEFWIEPSTHAPQAGSVLAAGLHMGHADDKEPYSRNPKHLAEFSLVGRGATRQVPGKPGEHPAGRVRILEADTYVLTYRSNTTVLEMEPEKFESYLVEEGLEGIVTARRERGESAQPGREAYSRCAKSLVRSPGAKAEGHDRVVGLPLELVPVEDPFAYVPGAAERKLSFRLLADGKPLAGAKVHAQSLDHLELAEIAARTDAKGQVELALPDDGRWVVSAVHMVRAPQGADHDWRSFWASITFPVAPKKKSAQG